MDTCALLLDRGADASQRDNCGKSSLDYARVKGHDYVVAMLTSHETSQSDFARVSRYVVFMCNCCLCNCAYKFTLF